jgi:GNAT superfamily N-acetyltransferase
VTTVSDIPAGVEIRRVSADDHAGRVAWLGVRNAVRTDYVLSLALVDHIESSLPWAGDFLATAGGEPVGVGLTTVWLGNPGSAAAWAELCVLPHHRRQGIGGAIFRRLSEVSVENGKRELRFDLKEGDEDSHEFLTRRGFSVVGRRQDSELAVAGSDVTAVDPPAGIRITTLAAEPGLAEGVYRVAQEAEPDSPSEETTGLARSFEEWRRLEVDAPDMPSEAQFAAVAGDQVVSYAFLSVSDVEDDLGWHAMTGTLRDWRGRGVASALKRAVVLWARERGLERLRTSNDEKNVPMLAINRRMGYRPLPARITMRGPTLPPGV